MDSYSKNAQTLSFTTIRLTLTLVNYLFLITNFSIFRAAAIVVKETVNKETACEEIFEGR